jgi:Ca2+-binding RTX toxin-like protein
MRFDSADIDQMVASGTFDSVVMHEIGHILGLGTLWSSRGLTSASADYIGANALREYRALSGNASADFIPIEHDGGSGTAGSHWDEETFDTELMTGYAESRNPMPISRMTVGSLEDLGYVVDYAAADSYTPPVLPPPAADDYTGNTSTTGVVAVGGSATGAVQFSGDKDWFRVALAAGASYTFNLVGASLSDPVLELRNGAGGLIASNDDSNGTLNSQIIYTATSSGAFFLSAGGYASRTGTYTLSVVRTGAPNPFTEGPDNVALTESGQMSNALGGNDTVTGTDGQDVIIGSGGDDILYGQGGGDILDGGLGDNTLDGGAGADALFGSIGVNLASYLSASAGVIAFLGGAQLNAGDAAGDQCSQIDDIRGSAFADILGGDAADNAVQGMDGNDWLFGGDGHDWLSGGDGIDILSGGLGNDLIDGGADFDAVSFRDAGSGVTVNFLDRSLNTGEALNDDYIRIENIWGSDFDDSVVSAAIFDQIYGFSGNDALTGGWTANRFYGGDGFDTLTGGLGADTFFFLTAQEGGDLITDFNPGEDRIFVSQFWLGIVTPGPAAAIDSALFVAGAGVAANRAGPQFLFETTSRELLFDVDGAGAQAAVRLATFASDLTLSSADIWRA